MFARAARYLVPVGFGATVFIPGHVYAKEFDPSSVYDSPSSGDCKRAEAKETELEKCVQKCRESFGPAYQEVTTYTEEISNFCKQYSDKVKQNLHFLQHKAPEEVRIATVASGGLLGMLFGMRRGIFKKLIYTAVGATGGAYLAYPRETKQYAREGFSMIKTYGLVAYNFAIGGGKVPGTSSDPTAKCPAVKARDESKDRSNSMKCDAPTPKC